MCRYEDGVEGDEVFDVGGDGIAGNVRGSASKDDFFGDGPKSRVFSVEVALALVAAADFSSVPSIAPAAENDELGAKDGNEVKGEDEVDVGSRESKRLVDGEGLRIEVSESILASQTL